MSFLGAVLVHNCLIVSLLQLCWQSDGCRLDPPPHGLINQGGGPLLWKGLAGPARAKMQLRNKGGWKFGRATIYQG